MSKSLWQRADELADQFHDVWMGPQSSHLAQLGEELAKVVKDLAERVGLREEAVEPLVPGQKYTLLLRVEATCVERGDGHGLAYELELERRDFYTGRTVSVDHDEILEAAAKE